MDFNHSIACILASEGIIIHPVSQVGAVFQTHVESATGGIAESIVYIQYM